MIALTWVCLCAERDTDDMDCCGHTADHQPLVQSGGFVPARLVGLPARVCLFRLLRAARVLQGADVGATPGGVANPPKLGMCPHGGGWRFGARTL